MALSKQQRKHINYAKDYGVNATSRQSKCQKESSASTKE